MYSVGGRRSKRRSKKRSSSKKCKPCPPCPKKSSRKKRKSTGKKRPLNAYFKLMLAAKKAGKDSFVYKGSTYRGKKHHRLGMIYKRA